MILCLYPVEIPGFPEGFSGGGTKGLGDISHTLIGNAQLVPFHTDTLNAGHSTGHDTMIWY